MFSDGLMSVNGEGCPLGKTVTGLPHPLLTKATRRVMVTATVLPTTVCPLIGQIVTKLLERWLLAGSGLSAHFWESTPDLP
jgi:hypothetical protein